MEKKDVLWNRGNKEEIKMLENVLKEHNASSFNYLGYYIIEVDEDKYLESLSKIQNLALETNLTVGSINNDGNMRPLLATPLLYGTCPSSKLDRDDWEEPFYTKKPTVILNKKILNDLSQVLGCHVYAKVHGDGVEILASTPIDNQKELSEIAFQYLENKKLLPFKKVYKLDEYGDVIKENEENEEDIPYNDLFQNSIFFNAMTTLRGSGIDVKKKEFDKTFTKYQRPYCYSFGCDDFNCNVKYVDDKTYITGKFCLFEENSYNNYWDHRLMKTINIPCTKVTRYDDVTFLTEVEEINDDTVCLRTNFNNQTKYKTYNKLLLTARGVKASRRYLLNRQMKKDELSDTIEEYYTKISDGTRLLHYTPNSPFFEIFEIDDDFDFKDNSEVSSYPKVFNSDEYDIKDKDLEEVSRVMNEIKTYIKKK